MTAIGGEIWLVESPRDLKLAHGARTVVVEYGLGGSPGRREFPLDGLGANANFLQVCGVNLGLLMRHLTGVGTLM